MEGFFEKVKEVYIKVQAVCCFTSLLAPLSIVLAMVIFGFTVGLTFLLVGAAIGAAIAVGLFGGLFLLIPAAVTIPHYFKEVRYNL